MNNYGHVTNCSYSQQSLSIYLNNNRFIHLFLCLLWLPHFNNVNSFYCFLSYKWRLVVGFHTRVMVSCWAILFSVKPLMFIWSISPRQLIHLWYAQMSCCYDKVLYYYSLLLFTTNMHINNVCIYWSPITHFTHTGSILAKLKSMIMTKHIISSVCTSAFACLCPCFMCTPMPCMQHSANEHGYMFTVTWEQQYSPPYLITCLSLCRCLSSFHLTSSFFFKFEKVLF